MDTGPKGIFVYAVVSISVLLAGCRPVPSLYIRSQTIEPGDASSVDARIKMDSGDLKVTGGGPSLLTARYYYAVPTLRPELEYSVKDRKGMLNIVQVPVATIGVFPKEPGGRNAWDLRLDAEMPVDLSLDLGKVDGVIYLNKLSARRLELRLANGMVLVDLSGTADRDRYVRAHLREGTLKFKLPTDAGVKVNTERGIYNIKPGPLTAKNGGFINALYDDAGKFKLYMDVRSDRGEVIFE